MDARIRYFLGHVANSPIGESCLAVGAFTSIKNLSTNQLFGCRLQALLVNSNHVQSTPLLQSLWFIKY